MILWQLAWIVVHYAAARQVASQFGVVGLALLGVGSALVVLRVHVREVPLYWWAVFFLLLLSVQA